MKADTKASNGSIVDLINRRQLELGKSDEQIAQEAGFERAKTYTMIKHGHAKLPVQKVVTLATVLSIEPASLLRQLLAEAMPEVLSAVDSLLNPLSLTTNEVKLVQTFRELCKGQDVSPIVVEGNAVVALMVA